MWQKHVTHSNGRAEDGGQDRTQVRTRQEVKRHTNGGQVKKKNRKLKNRKAS